jgi:hypothetical protein
MKTFSRREPEMAMHESTPSLTLPLRGREGLRWVSYQCAPSFLTLPLRGREGWGWFRD